MKLRSETVVVLHELYHRKEEGKYIIGDPQTGDFMIIMPVEFRALQLMQSGLALGHVRKLLETEKEVVDVHAFLRELKEHGFIHKVDTKVISPRHDVVHDFTIPLSWLGGNSVRFLLVLLSIFGLFTLVWKGTIPSFDAFFYQDHLSVMLVFVIVMMWLLIAAREVMKFASAQAMGIHARLGFRNHYHVFLPKAYLPGMSEEQRHRTLGTGLLTLTSLTSVALLLSLYLPTLYQPFWTMVFLIGIIEILSECLLFLDTDLAVFITLTSRIHKLNRQAAKDLKEHWRLFWHGKGKESHNAYTTYAFFYIASIALAVILLGSYILPGMLAFVAIAWQHFTPADPLYVDAFLALSFFCIDLFFLGFATLRHHHLAHNTLFVNGGLLAIVAASYMLAGIGIQWFASTTDTMLTVLLSFALGIVISAAFIEAVLLAHPFTKYHDLFERALLPILAAFVPLIVVFGLPWLGGNAFLYALFLGGGMLTFAGLRELWRETRRRAIP